jgi:hypothetical protein
MSTVHILRKLYIQPLITHLCMKNVVFAIVVSALLMGAIPATPAVEAAPYRFSDRDADGWPRWIGQLR